MLAARGLELQQRLACSPVAAAEGEALEPRCEGEQAGRAGAQDAGGAADGCPDEACGWRARVSVVLLLLLRSCIRACRLVLSSYVATSDKGGRLVRTGQGTEL